MERVRFTPRELQHLTRDHPRRDGTVCGYLTPDVGGTCRKCGCLIGKTPEEDVPYREPTREERRKKEHDLIVASCDAYLETAASKLDSSVFDIFRAGWKAAEKHRRG